MKRFLHIAVASLIVGSNVPAVARDLTAEDHAISIAEKICLETDFSTDRIRTASEPYKIKEEQSAKNKLTSTFRLKLGETGIESTSLVMNWRVSSPNTASLCSMIFAEQINGELLMLMLSEKFGIDPSDIEEGSNGTNLFARGQFQFNGRDVVVTRIIFRKAGNNNSDKILLMFRPAEKVS